MRLVQPPSSPACSSESLLESSLPATRDVPSMPSSSSAANSAQRKATWSSYRPTVGTMSPPPPPPQQQRRKAERTERRDARSVLDDTDHSSASSACGSECSALMSTNCGGGELGYQPPTLPLKPGGAEDADTCATHNQIQQTHPDSNAREANDDAHSSIRKESGKTTNPNHPTHNHRQLERTGRDAVRDDPPSSPCGSFSSDSSAHHSLRAMHTSSSSSSSSSSSGVPSDGKRVGSAVVTGPSSRSTCTQAGEHMSSEAVVASKSESDQQLKKPDVDKQPTVTNTNNNNNNNNNNANTANTTYINSSPCNPFHIPTRPFHFDLTPAERLVAATHRSVRVPILCASIGGGRSTACLCNNGDEEKHKHGERRRAERLEHAERLVQELREELDACSMNSGCSVDEFMSPFREDDAISISMDGGDGDGKGNDDGMVGLELAAFHDGSGNRYHTDTTAGLDDRLSRFSPDRYQRQPDDDNGNDDEDDMENFDSIEDCGRGCKGFGGNGGGRRSRSFYSQRSGNTDNTTPWEDEEWTPEDSAYGAACPVFGFIPKHIRKMIEAAFIFLLVLALVIFVITTSIRISNGNSLDGTTTDTAISEMNDDYYVGENGGNNNNNGGNNRRLHVLDLLSIGNIAEDADADANKPTPSRSLRRRVGTR